MKWTNEPPKEDGYYWFYSKYDHPQIVKVFTWLSSKTGKKNRTVNYFNEYYELLEDACENDAIWAGPIPEPEE